MADFPEDVGLLVDAIERFGAAAAEADRSRLLAQIQYLLERLQWEDENAKALLEAYYKNRRTKEASATDAGQHALATRNFEIVAAAGLFDRVKSLQRYLVDTTKSHDPEAHEILQRAINVIVGYAAGYQNLRAQAIERASEGRTGEDEVLRARPIKGEINYADLSREHIRRYPKIRARLAE